MLTQFGESLAPVGVDPDEALVLTKWAQPHERPHIRDDRSNRHLSECHICNQRDTMQFPASRCGSNFSCISFILLAVSLAREVDADVRALEDKKVGFARFVAHQKVVLQRIDRRSFIKGIYLLEQGIGRTEDRVWRGEV